MPPSSRATSPGLPSVLFEDLTRRVPTRQPQGIATTGCSQSSGHGKSVVNEGFRYAGTGLLSSSPSLQAPSIQPRQPRDLNCPLARPRLRADPALPTGSSGRLRCQRPSRRCTTTHASYAIPGWRSAGVAMQKAPTSVRSADPMTERTRRTTCSVYARTVTCCSITAPSSSTTT